MNLPVCIVSFTSLAGVAAAQAAISPAHFRRAEGNTSLSSHLGRPTAPARYLQVHDDMQGTARTISEMSFRRDVGGGAAPALTAVVNVFLSSAATSAAGMSGTFDANHGTDRTRVAGTHLVQLPATEPQGHGAPFEYRLPFQSPFSYPGIAPLAWEVQLVSRSSGASVTFDAASGANTNPSGLTRTFGRGCRIAATGSVINASASVSTNWTQRTTNITVFGSRLPANSLVSLALGASDSRWAGLPLPFDLPGSAQGSSGACTIYTDFLLTVPQFTSASGSINASLGMTANLGMNGRSVFAQIAAPVAGVNPFHLSLSNGVEMHFQSPWTAVPVGYVENNTGIQPIGTARNNWGCVVRFE